MSAKEQHMSEYLRQNNTSEMVGGYNEQRVKEVIGALTHRSCNVGKTVSQIEIYLSGQFSVREAKAIRYRLRVDHSLDFVGFFYLSNGVTRAVAQKIKYNTGKS